MAHGTYNNTVSGVQMETGIIYLCGLVIDGLIMYFYTIMSQK